MMFRKKDENSVLELIRRCTKAILRILTPVFLSHKKLLDIFALFVMLSLPVTFFAQNQEIRFRNPHLQLSDYSIFCITEDYKGFMWFATENGLNRFDGANMTVYSKKSCDLTSLSNNRGTVLFETKEKKLWIGTTSGLNLYNREKDNFIHYFYEQKQGDAEAYNFINDIVEDYNGNLWLATSGGLCVFDHKEDAIVSFEKFAKSRQKLKVTNITNIVIYEKGKILASNTEGQLFEFDIKKGIVTELLLDNGGIDAIKLKRINHMLLTSNAVWLSTMGTGLVKIEKIENTHVWYKQYLHKPKDNKSISINDINSSCELNDNQLLIGTENAGLNILDYSSGEFVQIVRDPIKENTISGNSIQTFYKDRHNEVWMSVFNRGINIIDSSSSNFKSYKHNRYDLSSLCNSPITGFVEDEEGGIWISSDGSGLDYWDRATDKFTHFTHNPDDPHSPLSDAAVCLFKTKQNKILAGFYKGGVNILEKDKKSFRHITTENGLSSNDVFSIEEDDKGNVYIATYRCGLNVYNPKSKKVVVYKNDNSDKNSLGGNNVNLLFFDSKENLWFGLTNKGLDLMQKNEGNKTVFKHYRHIYGNDNSLSSNTVFAIIEDKKGKIWIGTGDGLNMLDLDSQKFTVYRTPGGLAENTIVGIIEDNKGRLWLSTLNGISMFDPDNGSFKLYNESDGLHGLRFNIRAAYYKSNDGEFFFGGIKGFTCFYPDSIRYDNRFPNLYLVSFKLFNKPVAIDSEGSPLLKYITESEQITLDYKQSVFTLEYAALNFKNPEKTQYAYMLDGFEKDWNYVGNKRTATYTNLNAGDYIFKVKCTNDGGDWNEKATELKIKVLPPWWATWWFRIIVIIAVLLIFYTVYYLKMRSIKRQRRILKETVKNRTIELNETNAALEEKNEETIQQKEELQVQAETLERTNSELEQNAVELSLHKNKLEELVKIRTAELEKSKRKAEESDRLKSAFLANMSHEIRTPMNAIVGFSQLLNLPDVNESNKRKYLKQISTNTDSLLVLIEDILDLSRIESDQISVMKERFFINTLLDEVFSSILVSYKNSEVILRLENKEIERSIMINSDRDRIKQVLINLFTNACKFTEKGYVNLGFELENGMLLFRVSDTGIGIHEEHLETIFDRFRKVADNKTKLFRGTGLGLAISKKIAILLGGDLQVRSELGKGSVFTFSLPDSVLVQK